jgi:predicted small integral membrane protein
MWESHEWNGQETAFGFITMIGIVLVVLLMPEPAESA